MRPDALLLKAGIGHLSLDDQARQERPHKLLDLEFLKNEAGTNVPAKGGALYASRPPRQRLIFAICDPVGGAKRPAIWGPERLSLDLKNGGISEFPENRRKPAD